MTTFYCFPNEQDYIDAITVTTVTTDADGAEVVETTQNPPANVDVIGVMYTNAGTDEEPNMVAKDGYHVNTVSPIEGWEAHQVNPATPARVYWGS